jgi:hypothetical protein
MMFIDSYDSVEQYGYLYGYFSYNRIKILYAPILKLQKGVMSGVMRSVMNEN